MWHHVTCYTPGTVNSTVISLHLCPPQGVVVMYDITNRPTFLNVPEWIDNTREYGSANTQIVLVGNKKDREDREVSAEEGHKLARMHRVKFYETSALTGENCDAVSESMSSTVVPISTSPSPTLDCPSLPLSPPPSSSLPPPTPLRCLRH